jgi:hypothetical protein
VSPAAGSTQNTVPHAPAQVQVHRGFDRPDDGTGQPGDGVPEPVHAEGQRHERREDDRECASEAGVTASGRGNTGNP